MAFGHALFEPKFLLKISKDFLQNGVMIDERGISIWKILILSKCTGTGNETAISESAMKYGTYCTSIAQNILQNPADAGRMCQRHLASRVERYAAAPAVPVIQAFLGK